MQRAWTDRTTAFDHRHNLYLLKNPIAPFGAFEPRAVIYQSRPALAHGIVESIDFAYGSRPGYCLGNDGLPAIRPHSYARNWRQKLQDELVRLQAQDGQAGHRY